MFRASLRPSSGGQTAFSLPIIFCPVKGNPYKVLRYGFTSSQRRHWTHIHTDTTII